MFSYPAGGMDGYPENTKAATKRTSYDYPKACTESELQLK